MTVTPLTPPPVPASSEPCCERTLLSACCQPQAKALCCAPSAPAGYLQVPDGHGLEAVAS
jgi:hypothetical protein